MDMSLPASRSSLHKRFLMSIFLAQIALVISGQIAEAFHATSIDSIDHSLVSKVKTPEENRALDRLTDDLSEPSKDIYNVIAHLNLQLDYVPDEMGNSETDRLSLLLEECLLDNFPPFQETANSAPFQLLTVNVLFGQQETIEVDRLSQRFERSFRLNIRVYIEGGYGILDGRSNMNHPTDEDFEYALSRFFHVDEGLKTFLYSYLTDPETILPFFQDVLFIRMTKDKTEDPALLDSDKGSSSTATVALVCITGILSFLAVSYLFVRSCINTGRKKQRKERPSVKAKKYQHIIKVEPFSESTDSSVDVEADLGDQTGIMHSYTGLLRGSSPSSQHLDSVEKSMLASNVGTYDVPTRTSLLAMTETSLARNLGAVPTKEKYVSPVKRKFGPASTMVTIDHVDGDGSCSTSTVSTTNEDNQP